MKILAMSDIHGRFDQFDPALLPEADLCIIAGDITTRGQRDTREFLASQNWIRKIVDHYPVTLWIQGNHDLLMPPDVYYPIGIGIAHRLHCILNRDFKIAHKLSGALSFYGVSMSPAYDMPELASQWEYMTARREVEAAAYALMPPDTDIVVSHCPPWLMLDAAGHTRNPDGTWEKRSIGSIDLRRFIERHQPKAVTCGHVHGAAGHLRYGRTDVYNVAEEWRIIEVEK